MAIGGVSCLLPPNGIRTVAAPIVESKRSESPFCEAALISPASAAIRWLKLPVRHASGVLYAPCRAIWTCWLRPAPFEARNLRPRSTIVLPFHCIRMRPEPVTSAITVASRFSSRAAARKASTFSGASTIAIRSWLSEIASSVPSSPAYFLGTVSRYISRLSASSPTATDTPPAPKSLQRLIRDAASWRRKSLCSLRSTGALPFCTSAPSFSIDLTLWDLDAPVAPPIPSLPVRPPRRSTLSPGFGASRRTFACGAAPTTAPISIRLAMYPG